MVIKKILYLLLLTAPLAQAAYVEPWDKEIQKTEAAPRSPMATLTERIILFYQTHITQITGSRSHYRPTSSQYMLEAIRKYGFVKGYIMGCDRLLRENGEEWVYRTKMINGNRYKWDPP